jgi:hypothetical protein
LGTGAEGKPADALSLEKDPFIYFRFYNKPEATPTTAIYNAMSALKSKIFSFTMKNALAYHNEL